MSARAKYLIMSLGAMVLGVMLAFATTYSPSAGAPVQTRARQTSSR